MDNKQTIIDNNARIDALTKRVNQSGVGYKDMLQERVDATNNTDYLMYYYAGDNVDFIENLDTSKVTSMKYMFSNCKLITTIPQLDTSSCINMYSMFHECQALTSIPQLDTSSVTDIGNVFYNCKALTEIPQLDTSSVTKMNYMFEECSKLTTIPLLDMREVVNTLSMFKGCKNLTNLTLKNIKVSLTIGSGTSYGTLLTDESLINTAKELWDLTGSTSQTLTMSTPSKTAIKSIYVKLVDITDDMIANDEYISNKKPCIECESTDEGAMTLQEYIISKGWSIA